MKKLINQKSTAILLFVILLTMTRCATKPAAAPDLPEGLLGISLGMKKADAEQRLRGIADFVAKAEKNQDLWQLRDDLHFDKLAVGYDREGEVRYITAFVNKETVRERIRFAEVGDLAQARAEVLEPHYRHTWKMTGKEGGSDFIVSVYGDNPDFVTMYSVAKQNQSAEEEEEEKN